MTTPASPLAALLDQAARHASQISQLTTRHDADHAEVTARIEALAGLTARLRAQLTTLTTGTGARPGGGDPAPPAATRRWPAPDGPGHAVAVTTLRAWVEQVYLPGYGQLAATLAPCWDQHPLCLYGIDILAGLWTALYQTAGRTPAVLTAQAEYQARILPALAEQMATETTRCPHSRPATTASHPRGTR